MIILYENVLPRLKTWLADAPKHRIGERYMSAEKYIESDWDWDWDTNWLALVWIFVRFRCVFHFTITHNPLFSIPRVGIHNTRFQSCHSFCLANETGFSFSLRRSPRSLRCQSLPSYDIFFFFLLCVVVSFLFYFFVGFVRSRNVRRVTHNRNLLAQTFSLFHWFSSEWLLSPIGPLVWVWDNLDIEYVHKITDTFSSGYVCAFFTLSNHKFLLKWSFIIFRKILILIYLKKKKSKSVWRCASRLVANIFYWNLIMEYCQMAPGAQIRWLYVYVYKNLSFIFGTAFFF